jgi:hypothetical protein
METTPMDVPAEDAELMDDPAPLAPLQRTMLEDGRSLLIEDDRMFLFGPQTMATPQTVNTPTHQENKDTRSISMDISEPEADQLATEQPLLDWLEGMVDAQMNEG